MAYTTINKSTDHFNTVTYSGTGSAQSITGVGFQPDWVWIKHREDVSNHKLQDVVRGSTKVLGSNENSAEATVAQGVTSFDSDGFSLGTDASVNGTGAAGIVAWNWKAGGTGSANSDGDIASTVSANTTAGFSIVKWTANGSNADTVGHGLGAAPKIVLYKNIDQTGSWYWVYTYVDDSLDYLHINNNNTKADLTLGTYGFTTSTTITNLGFGNTHEILAYCFAEKKGYSRFGSYRGNGDANGTFIYTGFKPAFVLFKPVAVSGGHWYLYDNKRDTSNVRSVRLYPNLTNAEGDSSDNNLDFLSNGFKMRSTNNDSNQNGEEYIYMAFGQSLVGSNNIPCTAG